MCRIVLTPHRTQTCSCRRRYLSSADHCFVIVSPSDPPPRSLTPSPARSQLLHSEYNSSSSRLSVTSSPLQLGGGSPAFDASVFSSSFMVGFLFLLVPCSIAGELVQEREVSRVVMVMGMYYSGDVLSCVHGGGVG